MDDLKVPPYQLYEGEIGNLSPSPSPPASPSPQAWRLKTSETVADCRVFRVRRDVSADPRGGREHDFYVIEAPDWINVIPLTDDEKVVMIEQYRHGTGEVMLEIPGGMVDAGESPAATAARELLEETGYEAREVLRLGSLHPNPAIQNNRLHTFVARGAEFRGVPAFDGTEHTVVRLVPLADVPGLIAGGRVTHALVVAAFQMLSLSKGGDL